MKLNNKIFDQIQYFHKIQYLPITILLLFLLLILSVDSNGSKNRRMFHQKINLQGLTGVLSVGCLNVVVTFRSSCIDKDFSFIFLPGGAEIILGETSCVGKEISNLNFTKEKLN